MVHHLDDPRVPASQWPQIACRDILQQEYWEGYNTPKTFSFSYQKSMVLRSSRAQYEGRRKGPAKHQVRLTFIIVPHVSNETGQDSHYSCLDNPLSWRYFIRWTLIQSWWWKLRVGDVNVLDTPLSHPFPHSHGRISTNHN